MKIGELLAFQKYYKDAMEEINFVCVPENVHNSYVTSPFSISCLNKKEYIEMTEGDDNIEHYRVHINNSNGIVII